LGTKGGRRRVLYWQRNPVSLLQVEAGAKSTSSKTQRSRVREKIATTQKKNRKKKTHKVFFNCLKAWEKTTQ